MSNAKLTAVLASVLLLFAAACRTSASEPASQPYVVLVGIANYADEQILKRPHAEADAKALYDLFTNPGYLGVDAKHIRLLLGSPDSKRSSEPATHQNIIQAVQWAATNAGRNDLVLFAFFGQGAPLGERSCYFASDSTFKDRTKNAVAAADIEHALEKLKSHRFCAFLDVNFKGFNSGKEAAPDANLVNYYREFLGGDKDEDHPIPAGRIVFLANTRLKPSLDLAEHGVFAQVLLDGLSGAADREGYGPDGYVTVDELAEYMGKELPELVRKHGKTQEEKEQRDWVLGGRTSHFELTRNPAVTAKVTDRLQKFDKLASDKSLPGKIADEGRSLLRRMPKLEAQRSLRKAYENLVDGSTSYDRFMEERTKILDETKLKRSVAQAFAAKVIQASELIQKEYVKEVNQGDLVAAAIRGLFQRADEKVPKEIKGRLEKIKDLQEPELTALLADVRERLGNREDLANHKDIDYALQRMMTPLDPYTTYIDPEQLAQFKRETAGNFTGIGVQIRADSARDMLVVVTPIRGSPAYRAGLKAGDIITQITRDVDNYGHTLEKPEVISTKGLLISDAVKKIVGKAGTNVKLRIEREGVDHSLDFEITRGSVEVESVLGVKRHKDDSWNYVLDPQNRICYVRLTSYARNTARDLTRVMEVLKNSAGVKGLILDLRFNPGGLLTSAVEISDLFIDDGLIVTIRPRVGREQPYVGDHDGSLLDFPMVCLVNGHSASGSEIVSACLQDHKRALIMGERSYGKGSVQNIQPFEDGELKLTTASFWRPSGKNLNRSSTSGKDDAEWGVTPDKGYNLKLTRKELYELEDSLHKQEIIPRRDLPSKEKSNGFKDVQLETAVKYLRDQIKIASGAQVKKAG